MTQIFPGAGNQVVGVAASDAAGVVVELWCNDGTYWAFHDSITTSKAIETFTFTGVPAFDLIAIRCTTVGNGVVINAGITK